MPTFPIAHLTLFDIELVIVLPEDEFDMRPIEERLAIYQSARAAAAREGLTGQVVIVWQDGSHRTKFKATRFIAPAEQHAFFQIVKYSQLRVQANRTITWQSSL